MTFSNNLSLFKTTFGKIDLNQFMTYFYADDMKILKKASAILIDQIFQNQMNQKIHLDLHPSM